MVTLLPLPAGLPLDAASWAQTLFVLCQVVLQLVEVIQQQHTTIQPLEARIQPLEARIAELEARVQQRSRNSDRPPSSDSPYEKRPARPGTQGKPDTKPGHRGHQQALLAPTEVIELKPEACACGQTEFPTTTPYHTYQVVELPEIQMVVKHIVLHETCCPRCGRPLKTELPTEYRLGAFDPPGAWVVRIVHLPARYRQRQDEAGKFARTSEQELGALWTFVVEKGVDPTNNRAERALRFAVLWRRMMQGT